VPLTPRKQAVLRNRRLRDILKTLLRLYVGGPIQQNPWPAYVPPASLREIQRLLRMLHALARCGIEWPRFIDWLHEAVLLRLSGLRSDPFGRRVQGGPDAPLDRGYMNRLLDLTLMLLRNLPAPVAAAPASGYARDLGSEIWRVDERIRGRHLR
jgi:hypothetical protein